MPVLIDKKSVGYRETCYRFDFFLQAGQGIIIDTETGYVMEEWFPASFIRAEVEYLNASLDQAYTAGDEFALNHYDATVEDAARRATELGLVEHTSEWDYFFNAFYAVQDDPPE
jgi:hypothetical protein